MRPASALLALLPFAPTVWGRIKYLGVALAGIDFGCDIDGSCPLDTVQIPLSTHGGPDGEGQMKHWVKNYDMNMFRLSSTWQFLTNDNLGGKLDKKNFGIFDELMQACLDTGAYCIIDIHNFARYDGGIIGQGGPTDEVFADLLTQLTKKYPDNEKVAFGLMNEPHDIDINRWGETCQVAVNAIRAAETTDHMILLPGTNFTNVETFIITGSAEALHKVTNPDGSYDNLFFDFHKYLDENNSGTHETCTTDNVEAYGRMADWLREHGRKAIISESGATMDETCFERFCRQNEFINDNIDVFEGFIGWGAGAFAEDYLLSLTPKSNGDGTFVDNRLMTECIVKPFGAKPQAKPTTTKKTSTHHHTSTKSSSTEPTSTGASSTITSAPAQATETGESEQVTDDSAAASVGVSFFTILLSFLIITLM